MDGRQHFTQSSCKKNRCLKTCKTTKSFLKKKKDIKDRFSSSKINFFPPSSFFLSFLVTQIFGKAPSFGQLIHFSRVAVIVEQTEELSTRSWRSDSAPPRLWVRQKYFHGLLFPVLRILCTSVGLLSVNCQGFMNSPICLCELVRGFVNGAEMREDYFWDEGS